MTQGRKQYSASVSDANPLCADPEVKGWFTLRCWSSPGWLDTVKHDTMLNVLYNKKKVVHIKIG